MRWKTDWSNANCTLFCVKRMQIVPRYYDTSKKMDGQMQTEKCLNIHIIGKSNESIDYRAICFSVNNSFQSLLKNAPPPLVPLTELPFCSVSVRSKGFDRLLDVFWTFCPCLLLSPTCRTHCQGQMVSSWLGQQGNGSTCHRLVLLEWLFQLDLICH